MPPRLFCREGALRLSHRFFVSHAAFLHEALGFAVKPRLPPSEFALSARLFGLELLRALLQEHAQFTIRPSLGRVVAEVLRLHELANAEVALLQDVLHLASGLLLSRILIESALLHQLLNPKVPRLHELARPHGPLAPGDIRIALSNGQGRIDSRRFARSRCDGRVHETAPVRHLTSPRPSPLKVGRVGVEDRVEPARDARQFLIGANRLSLFPRRRCLGADSVRRRAVAVGVAVPGSATASVAGAAVGPVGAWPESKRRNSLRSAPRPDYPRRVIRS